MRDILIAKHARLRTAWRDVREVRLNIDLGDGVTTFGTCDRLIVWPSMETSAVSYDGVLIDYKFGYWPVEPAEDNVQAQAYVLGAFQWEPLLQSLTVYFFLPRQNKITSHTYTRADMPRIQRRIRRIIDAAEDPNSPYRPADKLCEFCAKAADGSCPAVNKRALAVALKYDEKLQVPDLVHGSQITNPVHMAQLLQLGPVLTKAISGWRKRAGEMLEKGIEIPGYHRKLRGGDREITSPQAAWDLVKDYLTEEEFRECAEVSLVKLLDKVASKAPHGQKGKIKEQLEDAMTDAGIIERGAAVFQVARNHKQKAEN